MAAVSVYYYLRVIQAKYFKEGEGQELEVSAPFKGLLIAVAAVVILLGVYPSLLLNWLTIY